MGSSTRARAAIAAALMALVAALVAAPGASADPIGAGTASAHGLTASVAGTVLISPTPWRTVVSPPFGAQTETTLSIPAPPLAVSGTLTATAAVRQASELASGLEVNAQPVAGPYNAQGLATLEDLEVLQDVLGVDVTLLEADAIRAEAVAVCSAGTVTYAAQSEVVNLVIAGEDALTAPLNELIGSIADLLDLTEPLVDLDLNVVTESENGIAVDAVVLTVLSALGAPVLDLRIGHAEVSDVTACSDPGDGGEVPECADDADNDGDGLVDEADPGCHTDGDPTNPESYDPEDDSEHTPGCADGVDNDGDGLVDGADPGCHTDGDPTNPESYDPNDDDETHVAAGGALPKTADTTGAAAAGLPRTGGGQATGVAALLATAAAGLLALRRRAA